MPQRLPDVNLLPTFKQTRAGAPYALIVFMTLVILAFIFLGVYYFLAKNNLSKVDAEYDRTQDQIELLQTQLNELKTTSDDTPTLSNAVNFAEGHAIPTSVFILELVDLLPENSYINEYTYQSKETRIEVHLESLDLVAEYTANLNYSPFAIDTKLNSVDTFVLKDEEIIDIEPDEVSETTESPDDPDAEGEPDETTIKQKTNPRYQANLSIVIDPLKIKEAALSDD